METQAPDIDGCVLINDAPEDFVPVPGEMVNVLITEAQEYDLLGRIFRVSSSAVLISKLNVFGFLCNSWIAFTR